MPAIDHSPQRDPRPRACVRCREREPGRLQLRVILRAGEGVCDVLVEEDDRRVAVLILVRGEVENRNDEIDCPVHVRLLSPLGARQVVDTSRGDQTVEAFSPDWWGPPALERARED